LVFVGQLGTERVLGGGFLGMTVFQPAALRGHHEWSAAEQVMPGVGRVPGRTVLLSAGDGVVSSAVAQAFAATGADIVLLHQCGAEDVALGVAARVEAFGRRCELFAGDLDDVDFCQEGALQAAFLGSGKIDVVVSVAGPSAEGAVATAREARRTDLPGLRALVLAAAPHLTRETCLVHVQSTEASRVAEDGRSLAAIAGWARRELRGLPLEDQAMVHCLSGSPEEMARRAVALACLPERVALAG